MDNISIVIQDQQNPIVVQNNSEFNAIQDGQPVFIHQISPDGGAHQIINLDEWNNQFGEFKISLVNTNTYDSNENIFYSYNGNSNHIELVKMSEIIDYSLPTIIFMESSKFYYTVKVVFEKKIELDIILEQRFLNSIETNPDEFQGEIYIKKFPDPFEFRDILTQLKDTILPQLNNNNSEINNFVTGYVKIIYSIFKITEIGDDQLIKTISSSLILIPPVDTQEDSTKTK